MFFFMFAKVKKIKTQYRNIVLKIKCFYLCRKISFFMKKQVIVVAGGSGRRMGLETPKQFIEVAGKPILLRTLENFHLFDSGMDIVVVLPEKEIERWKHLCRLFDCQIQHRIVEGGATRFQSVKNGLKLALPDAIIAIHDGVRPFVSHKTLTRCFDAAMQFGTAVPCVDIIDSLRMTTAKGNCACDRSLFKAVQTPQVFKSELLMAAYNQPFNSSFTDDASVVETCSPIHLVEGDTDNIKITTPFDLQMAELILKSREKQ